MYNQTHMLLKVALHQTKLFGFQW